MTLHDMEDVKKSLIALISDEEKTTDRTIQMIQEGFDKAIENGMKDVAKQALEYRLIDKRCFGRILRDSIIINDLDTLMLLTRENPEKEYYNAYKRALQMAAEEGNLEVIRFLVSYGADIHSNKEPLNLAVRHGHIEIVRYLVRHGADINASLNGFVYKSLLDYFIRNRDDEMIRYLIDHGFQFKGGRRRFRIVVELVDSGNIDYLEYILEKVESDNRGFQKDVLECALYMKKTEVVRYIVGKMNSEDQDCCDRIIRKSVKNGGKSKKYVDFLENCGVDVDRVMRIGRYRRYRKKAAAT